MFENIKKWVSSVYFQYQLITNQIMLEPWEKRFINGLVLLMLALVTFSSYVYLPRYTQRVLQFLTPANTVIIKDES